MQEPDLTLMSGVNMCLIATDYCLPSGYWMEDLTSQKSKHGRPFSFSTEILLVC